MATPVSFPVRPGSTSRAGLRTSRAAWRAKSRASRTKAHAGVGAAADDAPVDESRFLVNFLAMDVL